MAATQRLLLEEREGWLDERGERWGGGVGGDNNKRVAPRLKLFGQAAGARAGVGGQGNTRGKGTSRWLQARGKAPSGTEAGQIEQGKHAREWQQRQRDGGGISDREAAEEGRWALMAGMELHCELLSSRGWARAGEKLFAAGQASNCGSSRRGGARRGRRPRRQGYVRCSAARVRAEQGAWTKESDGTGRARGQTARAMGGDEGRDEECNALQWVEVVGETAVDGTGRTDGERLWRVE